MHSVLWQCVLQRREPTYAELLAQATLDVDFENDVYAWGGQSRVLSDMTDNGDGSYDLAYTGWYSGAATIIVEYENAEGASATGNIFSWTNAANQRLEFEMFGTTPSSGVRVLFSPPTSYGSISGRLPDSSEAGQGRGRQRIGTAFTAGVAPNMMLDNWGLARANLIAGALTAPSKLTFGRRARFNDQPLANCTLHRVMIWARELSNRELDILSQGPNKPIHLLGDSFLNLQVLRGELSHALASYAYTPISQDNVPGTSLTQQMSRLARNVINGVDVSKLKNSTLVIMDGGLDGTSAEAIAAIQGMIAMLPHDRWLWVEPAPQEEIGTGSRPAWDANVAAITAFVGNRLVPTYDEALAAGDNSAEDNAEIAKGLWPLSLKTSVSDFHPSAAGHTFLAEQIAAKLLAMGWLPA